MHIQTDRAFIPVATSSVRYLQVVISAPPAPAAAAGAARSPVDIAVVLDRSGSMDGSKITMARKAVTHAVRLLKPDDHVAVVCYDDQVDTVLERTLASREAKALVMGRLAGIEPRGSTNLSGGWLAGAHELQPAYDAGPAAGTGALPAARVKRVLLLTDGLANAGEVDPQALAATAARLRTEGVTTSTFGIRRGAFDEAQRILAQGMAAVRAPPQRRPAFARRCPGTARWSSRVHVHIDSEAPQQLPGRAPSDISRIASFRCPPL